MALTDQDRETITLIAGNVAEKIIEKVLMAHVQSCPHGQKLNTKIAWVSGACAVVGVLSGVLLGVVIN